MVSNRITQHGASTQVYEERRARYGRLIRRLEAMGVEMSDNPDLVLTMPGGTVVLQNGQLMDCYWHGYERIYNERRINRRDVLRQVYTAAKRAEAGQPVAMGPVGRKLLFDWCMSGEPEFEEVEA